MTEILPVTRTDRVRSVLVLLGLFAAFAGVAVAVDAVQAEPVHVTVRSGVPLDGSTSAGSALVEGDFLVSGSSTVYPIVLRQAEQFGALNQGVAISVEGPGSGDGAQKFCAGEVPIANASRLYKDQERAICADNNVDYIEIRRGIDGISVITSPENDLIDCVSFNDLYALVSEEALDFHKWSDANVLTSIWDGTQFPDVDLQIFGPGEESGTFDSFGEIVVESVAKGKTGLDPASRDFVKTIRPDYTSSPDDNVILEGVGSSKYSIGWVGYAFAKEAESAGRAKLLDVSFADEGSCVAPTPETIASADFPIARYLYTYVNAEAAASDASVAAFVDYMMSDVGLESVAEVGYVGLAKADQVRARAVWNNRIVGPSWD